MKNSFKIVANEPWYDRLSGADVISGYVEIGNDQPRTYRFSGRFDKNVNGERSPTLPGSRITELDIREGWYVAMYDGTGWWSSEQEELEVFGGKFSDEHQAVIDAIAALYLSA